MKKFYSAPAVNVEVFETKDVITISLILIKINAADPEVKTVDLDEEFAG